MAELTINDIIKEENLVYKKTKVMTDNVMHYCPGCGHGTTHRLVAEVIEELGIQDKTIGVTPVGCSVLMYNYLDIDMQEAAHGRAPAIARGLCPTSSYSPIRATATWLLSVLPKQSTAATEEKTSPSYS